MTDFGMTEAGFTLKRLSDILSDMAAALSLVQDPVTGETLTPDLQDENDPLIQEVNAFSDGLALAWEQLQIVNNQFDPLKSVGAGLSGLVQLNGLRRKEGTPTTVPVTLTGVHGTLIPESQISDINDVNVFNVPATQIGGGGTVTVNAVCSVNGPVEAVSGTLVKIMTPKAGWTSVTNAVDAVPGTFEESDTSLRARRDASTATTGRSTIDDMFGSISNLGGVKFCRVYQNITLEEDVRGIPAKSVAVVVLGGDETEIARIIFEHIGAGCASYGGVTVVLSDTQAFSYPTSFSRPIEVPIFIDIEVTVIQASAWPTNGVDVIKAAILKYVATGAASFGLTEGFDPTGYLPGMSVYASELYTAINSQPGIRILSVLVGITDTPADQYVTIAWNELATFLGANIVVTVS